MTLDDLVGRGLQREPASAEELRRMRRQIATRLADARSPHISRGSRFDIAYEALLQIGLAALRAHGLRPDSRGGHHVLALQSLATTIGYPRDKIRLLDQFRRQRAAALYDGAFEPSEVELDALLDCAQELSVLFEQWLRDNRAELA